MTTPTGGYTSRATSPIAQSPVTAGKQEDDRGAQSSDSARQAGSSSGSGYPAQLTVANRKQAAKLQAEAQLRKHFRDLENLPPGSSESCDAKINDVVNLLREHGDLAYDVLDECKKLEDDEKKCKVYVGLSQAVGFLPFEGGLGWAFAQTLLQHHDNLPSEQQNPVKILRNLLRHSQTRIDRLQVSDHEKNHQRLEWYVLLIPALHRHKDKIFSKSENNDVFEDFSALSLLLNDPKDLNIERSLLSDSLISCMKEGDIPETMKARISGIIFSDMLPILESLSLFEKAMTYQKLLENLSDLIPENKRGEFVLKILRPYLSLQGENLTLDDRRCVVEAMLAITKKIPAIPSQKAVWVHRMRALLLGQCIHIDDSGLGITLKVEIFKTLSRCRSELEDAEDLEIHLSALRKIADIQRDPDIREMTLRWVDNPQEAERIEQEGERREQENEGGIGEVLGAWLGNAW